MRTYSRCNRIDVPESKTKSRIVLRVLRWWLNGNQSDYKDDGTNVLLDANENAYGPGLALRGNGKLDHVNGEDIEIDLLGLNRYPDP